MVEGKGQDLTLDQAMEGLPKDFAFFADHFRTNIQPQLAEREGERLAAVKKQFNFTIAAVILAALAATAGFVFFQSPFGLILGGMAAFGLYAWGSTDLNRLGKETKLMLVQPVSAEFGVH